jgi:hypothetical protein
MLNYLRLIFLGSLILMGSCTPGNSQFHKSKRSKKEKGNYEEDLQSVRPVYPEVKEENSNPSLPEKPVPPTKDITKSINYKISLIAGKNQKYTMAEGYRVVVYTGSSREEVKKINEKLKELIPGEKIYSTYRAPVFRVKVGDYFNRIEAYSTLMKIKKDFPNAIIVPDQVPIYYKEEPEK